MVKDQTRREELDRYHAVLDNVGRGMETFGVKQLVIDAFVRGALAKKQTGDFVDLEGFTTIFSKRRYRDHWNRGVISRLARNSDHSMKIQGVVVNGYASVNEPFKERTKKLIKRHAKTQALWNLKLSGNWHPSYETSLLVHVPHMMRVMLLANIDMDQHFANGTQGRLLYWSPSKVEGRAPLSAMRGDISVRFAKEASIHKENMSIEVDFLDIKPRRETISSFRGG